MEVARLRTAIRAASVPALVLTTATLIRDPSFLDRRWAPAATLLGDTWPDEIDPEEIRAACLDRLEEWAARGETATTAEATVLEAVWRWTGLQPSAERVAMLAEEVALLDEDLKRPRWRYEGASSFDEGVAIIGSGACGIAAAKRLTDVGIPFTVYDKAPAPGGVWQANTYPGCRVDIPSQLYSFSFARRSDWPNRFSDQPTIERYLAEVSDVAGVYARTRFDTEVVALDWDDSTSLWTVTSRTGDEMRRETYRFVIAAVGTQGRPMIPRLAGIGDFQGQAFHSAEWEHDIDFDGLRVGVIGSGASSFQFVPELARGGARVSVFQRTAAWMLPTPSYYEELGDETRWLNDELPFYATWERVWALHLRPLRLGILEACRVDPAYEPDEIAVSAANAELREQLLGALHAQTNDPELLRMLTPHHPIGAKRMLHDNGRWIEAFRDHGARLLDVGIERIEADGIRTIDGTLHEFDVIVYSTGFKVSEFLEPISVRGRGGRDLHEFWDGDPRAYLGMMTPGFPNLAILYGPNTEPVVHGASIPYLAECQVGYLLSMWQRMITSDFVAVEVTTDAFDRYRDDVDARNAQMVWSFSTVRSWYKNARGGMSQALPYSIEEFWQQMREVVTDDFNWASR